MTNYVFKYAGVLLKFFFKFKKFIPGSVAGVFLLIDFFRDLADEGVRIAFDNLARSIFACELAINKNVHLAMDNSIHYGVNEFLEIVTSVFILYTLFLFLVKIFQFSMSSNIALFGAIFISAFVIFMVELSVLKMVGHPDFVPFRDGILLLFLNTTPVFNNIFGAASSAVAANSTNVSAFS